MFTGVGRVTNFRALICDMLRLFLILVTLLLIFFYFLIQGIFFGGYHPHYYYHLQFPTQQELGCGVGVRDGLVLGRSIIFLLFFLFSVTFEFQKCRKWRNCEEFGAFVVVR